MLPHECYRTSAAQYPSGADDDTEKLTTEATGFCIAHMFPIDEKGGGRTDSPTQHYSSSKNSGTIQKFPRLRSQEGVWINLANTYGGAGADSAKRQPEPIFDTSR